MNIQRLAEPFAPEDIEWRIQRSGEKNGKHWAMVLAYITNRAIMERLDEAFGVGGWKNEYKEWHGTSQLCGISAKIEDEWITKWDGADATNIEATKGGLSDAMKRAGVQWGIGRYLYKFDTNFVDLIEGRSKNANAVNVSVKLNENDKYPTNCHFMRPNLPDFAKVNQQAKATTQTTSPRKESISNELVELKTEILTKYKESGKETSKFKDFLLETIGLDEVRTVADAKDVLEALKK
jgi:hypothetical protein